ncbi:DUF6776 family protein [Aliiglaciecola sp. LCG003]|uniref:DUF6776 family protein n=1 Tax=Aliiglaciecola sp. LCG003 TaxID=3053655 RepID=UPI0025747165|nr:DUF6776 family protein [Aliiglaciecola sp. LCG003]WJG08919.1 hypothetical protein QR722_16515 [Aliiglaciecola sp. LCG003]
MIPEDIRKTWSAFKFYTLLLIVIAVVAYLAFHYGNTHYTQQQQKINTLGQTVQNLSADNQRLTTQLNILGVEIEVQRLAAQKSQETITNGLNREAQLRQELLFYQRVMAPELQQEGFIIEAFELKKSLSDNAYRFELVLMQQEKIKNLVKGTIEVTIVGSENGKPQQYNLADLLTHSSVGLNFSFKYFQILEGELIVPKSFSPEKVQVKAQVYQFKRKRGELEKSFDWNIDQLPLSEVSTE